MGWFSRFRKKEKGNEENTIKSENVQKGHTVSVNEENMELIEVKELEYGMKVHVFKVVG